MKESEDKKKIYFNQVYDNIKSIGYHTTAIMEEKTSLLLHILQEYLKILKYLNYLFPDLNQTYLEKSLKIMQKNINSVKFH